MNPEGVERKLAAILSADVVGYSRLMAEDEAATIPTITAYRQQISTLVPEHRGRVVDSPGDNVLAEFPTALDAVQGAVEIQRVIQARNADLASERRMEFRIGVHMGDVSVEGDRLYGDGVNIAARLEGLAKPGAVCISGTVYEQVQKKLNVALLVRQHRGRLGLLGEDHVLIHRRSDAHVLVRVGLDLGRPRNRASKMRTSGRETATEPKTAHARRGEPSVT